MRKVSLAAALMAVLMFAALPGHAATQTVTANGASFGTVYTLPVVQAGKGDTIKFVNGDGIGQAHTLTLDSTEKLCKSGSTAVLCDTGVVSGGSNKSFTLSTTIPPGQYPFHCNIHATMRGVLIV